MTLEELQRRTMSVCVEYNPHRNLYQSVRDYLDDRPPGIADELQELSDKDREALLAGDILVELQVYPNNPVGFFLFFGPTLAHVLEQAAKAMPDLREDDYPGLSAYLAEKGL